MRSEENKTVKRLLPSTLVSLSSQKNKTYTSWSQTCKLQLGAGINTRKAYRGRIVMRPYSFWKATQIPWTHRNIQQYDDWWLFFFVRYYYWPRPLCRTFSQESAADWHKWSLCCIFQGLKFTLPSGDILPNVQQLPYSIVWYKNWKAYRNLTVKENQPSHRLKNKKHAGTKRQCGTLIPFFCFSF